MRYQLYYWPMIYETIPDPTVETVIRLAEAAARLIAQGWRILPW